MYCGACVLLISWNLFSRFFLFFSFLFLLYFYIGAYEVGWFTNNLHMSNVGNDRIIFAFALAIKTKKIYVKNLYQNFFKKWAVSMKLYHSLFKIDIQLSTLWDSIRLLKCWFVERDYIFIFIILEKENLVSICCRTLLLTSLTDFSYSNMSLHDQTVLICFHICFPVFPHHGIYN